MGGAVKWLVCAGPGEFLFIAAALIATGCSGGVEWERHPERAYARGAQLATQGNVNTIVGGGLEHDDSEEVACTLASMANGMSVWCANGAREGAARAYARGVSAAVEPAGLMQVLAGAMARADAAGADAAASAAEPVDGVEDDAAAGKGASACEGADGMPPVVYGQLDDLDDPSANCSSSNREACRKAVPLAVRPTAGSRRPVVRGAARRRVKRSGPSRTLEAALPSMPAIAERSPAPVYPKAPAIQLGGVTTEPIAYRPVIDLPQLECDVAGADVHVPTICFTSARGGVGKTSLAVLMALTLARDGFTVALIDFDFQFGTCLRCIGAEETFGLMDAGMPPERVRVDAQTLARCRVTPERGLAAFEFCRAPEQAEVLTGMAGRLLKSARAGADIAIVDLPAGMNEAVVQTLDLVDRCLFVADQRAFSLESLIAQQSLCARMGVARTKLMTVMNRCDPRHRDEGFLSRVRFEIQTPQVMRVVDGGAEVAQMMSIGSAGELLTMRNRFALSAADLAHVLCSDVGCQPRVPAATAPMLPVLATLPAQSAAPREGLFKKRKKEKRGDQVICPF